MADTTPVMKPLQFAANLSFLFPEVLDIPKRYSAAKNAGFLGVECGNNIYDYALPDLTSAIKATNLKQVHMNAFCGENKGLAAVPQRETEFKQCLELSIQYCKTLCCNRLHIMAGQYPENCVPSAEMITAFTDTFVQNLKYASKRLELELITALIEPISTVENYFLTSTHQAIEILNIVDCRNVKLQLDLYHHQRTHGKPLQAITEYLPYIGHIQVAQVPHRNEPDSPGEIDFSEVFTHLVSLGYDGWIGCEYAPSFDDDETSFRWLQPYLIKPTM